jgi:glycosyltransferase involved in cell wall biosynthesis
LTCRLSGYSLLHIHWTFNFRFPGGARFKCVRRAARLWFVLVLGITRRLGFGVVWTAHNVLPHSPVFDDDVEARRALVGAANLVLAHSPAALADVSRLAAPPRAARVIPHGPILAPGISELAVPPDRPARTVLFFGRVETYKGIEDLLEAARELALPLRFVIAGECRDRALHDRLISAARTLPTVELRLMRVPEKDLASLFEAADAVVFPFRAVTTSGSIMLAMASARPVIVPRLPAFAEVPADALIRYEPGTVGLRQALIGLTELPAEARRAIGIAGRAASTSPNWGEIATLTATAMRDIAVEPPRDPRIWRRFRVQSDMPRGV